MISACKFDGPPSATGRKSYLSVSSINVGERVSGFEYLTDDQSLRSNSDDLTYSTESFRHLHFQSILLSRPVLDSRFEGMACVDG